MIRVRNWSKHQASIINHVKASRKTRGVETDGGLVMQKINVSSSWDDDFVERFAPAVGHRSAETYFIRLLQYVATHDGMRGECRVPRDEFGPIVLTRVGDPVNAATGRKVYDALLASEIAVTLLPCVTGDAPEIVTCDALPFPTLPVPTSPLPSGPYRAGVSPAAPSPNGEGTAEPLTASDRAVFDLLAARTRKKLPPGGHHAAGAAVAKRAEDLRKTPDPAEIRAFIDKHDACDEQVVAEVSKIRINATMKRKDRGG